VVGVRFDEPQLYGGKAQQSMEACVGNSICLRDQQQAGYVGSLGSMSGLRVENWNPDEAGGGSCGRADLNPSAVFPPPKKSRLDSLA